MNAEGQGHLTLRCLDLITCSLAGAGRREGDFLGGCVSPGASLCSPGESPAWSVCEEKDLCRPQILLLYHPAHQGLQYGAGQAPAHHSGAAMGKDCFSPSSTQKRQLKKKFCKCFSCYFPCLALAFPQRVMEVVHC